MTRRLMAVACVAGLALVVAGAPTASAQTNEMNAFGGFQPMPQPPVGQAPGSYVVAPSLPGTGGTYAYAQQNYGGAMGMSPNAYFSRNFFTRTPMTNTYASGYTGYTYGNPGYSYGTQTYTYGTSPTYTPNYGYGTPTYSYRRGGPFRRMFGRR